MAILKGLIINDKVIKVGKNIPTKVVSSNYSIVMEVKGHIQLAEGGYQIVQVN